MVLIISLGVIILNTSPIESNVDSPYYGHSFDEWTAITNSLIDSFPVSRQQIVSLVQHSWKQIFQIGTPDDILRIGKNTFPQPTTIGYFLHEIIAKNFELIHSNSWQEDPTGYSKDVIYLPNENFSFEIKTSSSNARIYGNRSYANPGKTSKKGKSSYYLAVNFNKFESENGVFIKNQQPTIKLIRFGWIDHSDWVGQKAASGQAAHIPVKIERAKLVTLWKE